MEINSLITWTGLLAVILYKLCQYSEWNDRDILGVQHMPKYA